MRDDALLPADADDPEIEGALRTLDRFSPRRGFEDRVVSRVRVPIPRWLRRMRDSFRGMVSGVTGWTILGTFSAATAAAWGAAIVAGVRYGDVAAASAGFSWDQAVAAVRAAFFEFVAVPVGDAAAALAEWARASALPIPALLVGYGFLVVVSAVALWRLTAEPARAKGTI